MSRAGLLTLLLCGCHHAAPAPDDLGPDSAPPDLATSPRDLARPPRDLAAPSFDLAQPPDLAFRTTLADGVCAPSPLASGIYDPDCVYVIGTLSPGAAGVSALVEPSQPDDFVIGFGAWTHAPFIRPTDGKLLFLDTTHSDDLIYVFQVDRAADFGAYPTYPLSNDSQISTVCAFGVFRAYAFPDDGAIAYRCEASITKLYVQGGSTPLYDLDAEPLAMGAERSVLLEKDSVISIFQSGVNTPVAGLPAFTPLAYARSHDDGFLLVLAEVPDWEVFQVSRAGSVRSLGKYVLSAHPPRMLSNTMRVMPDGSLVGISWGGVSDGGDFEPDTIWRLSVSAPPELVYDETGKRVRLFTSDLATGP